MKKNRPGVLLTVLADPENVAAIEEIIFAETSAFGMRMIEKSRSILEREFREISTAFGMVTIKIGLRHGKIIQRSPEFECCRQLAEESGRPIREIFAAAIAAAQLI